MERIEIPSDLTVEEITKKLREILDRIEMRIQDRSRMNEMNAALSHHTCHEVRTQGNAETLVALEGSRDLLLQHFPFLISEDKDPSD